MEEVDIKDLKFDVEDDWLREYANKNGNSIDKHPLYLALKGDKSILDQWCTYLKNIWLMERIDLLLDVYKSLIRYGQLEPIRLKADKTIITGHKRACVLLIMGKDKVKAVYE